MFAPQIRYIEEGKLNHQLMTLTKPFKPELTAY